MSELASRDVIPSSEIERIRAGRDVVRQQARVLADLSTQLDARFAAAAKAVEECRGTLVITGMGKAGLIGRKLAATFSSTGTRSLFLHPAEAVHGDLGCLGGDDLVLALSNSGETEELCRLLPIFRQMNLRIVAITADTESTLGADADITLPIGRMREAGALALAPSTTTTAMLAIGDALALVVSEVRGFTAREFAVFHPGGSLGARLQTVAQVMRPPSQLRTAQTTETIREVLIRHRVAGRRTGVVLVVDSGEQLAGIFTDSDLARLLEERRDVQLDRPISEVMTRQPITVPTTISLQDAVQILSDKKVSELPVVDDDNVVVGMIDITDVIGLLPQEAA